MITFLLLWLQMSVYADTIPAFPGAEGAGAGATGGRGGDVYHVTNLNDAGPGSLRNGIVTATGPRTIVFDLSGTIMLASALRISKPDLTIAGQTAPGEGITIAGWTVLVTQTRNVIIRYLRIRAGDAYCPAMQGDALWIDRSADIVLDHLSTSWSVDETLSVSDSDRVTVQWSLITESLNTACHEKGDHGYGSLLRGGAGTLTFHHNLYAHHRSRNPRLGDDVGLDFVNNVIYNAGGEVGYSGEAVEGKPRLNYVNNYVVAGPSTSSSRRTRAFSSGSTNTLIWQSGNLVDGNLNKVRDGVDTGWAMFAGEYTRQASRFDFPRIQMDAADVAYGRVLASAGQSRIRDAVDKRVLGDVAQETGKIIGSQTEVGGWPALRAATAPVDTDQDGMPDAWELAQHFDPTDPRDGAAITASGYSNLEVYLNDLVTPATRPVGGVLLRDTFSDGDSQNQDLANHSIRLFNGRTNNIRTDAPGSATFDTTPAGTGSEAFWGYFTEAGAPVELGVGDKLSVSVNFSVSGFAGTGQDIRWGVLNSLGTRNTANLGGGQNDATFVNDTGYGMQFYASGTGNPFVLGRRAVLTGANPFNSFGDFATIAGAGATQRQALANDTLYTLTYSIERLTETSVLLSGEVTGGELAGLSYSGMENSPEPNTAFDYFTFRIGGSAFARQVTFTEILVEYVPAPPVILSQPQPSSLTVQTGSNVTMAVAAAGSAMRYQWEKGRAPIEGNDSAQTPALALRNVQLPDAGAYTAVVSNAGGSVRSNAVELRVSTTPVPPAPAISRQPAGATVTIGDPAELTVAATGAGLFYQWFKEGAILPGATGAALTFARTQASDAGTYSVVVSNSSGSVQSAQATLLIVSRMAAASVHPWPGETGICADAPLSIEFNEPPKLGRRGRVQVFSSAGALVDTIDLAASPQTRTIGGLAFVYYPILITGNTATVYLHRQLPYNDSYYVLFDAGVFVDSAGAPHAGFADPGLWRFRTRQAPSRNASGELLTVDGGNQGDFCTVQGAIDFVPAGNTQPVTIHVRPGTYREINYVPSNKPFLTVRGEDRDTTIISYANNANLNQSNARVMFGVDAPDFTLQDITLHNTTPQGGSQAEAFRGNNQRILLDRVTLKSYQDTLFLQGLAMIRDSYIEGDVDFLWGAGTVFIRNTEIRTLRTSGYITQIRNGQGQNGYVFVNCRLTAPEGISGVYLSRIDPTVFPYSQAIFINTEMGPHIHPAGWLLNNATTAPNVQFFEYRSVTPGGAPVDVSQRLNASRQLTAAEAARWSDAAVVLNGWSPSER